MIDALLLALEAVLTCDICIIGAGPVGLSTAREFVGSGKKVLILESGGTSDADNQDDLSDLAQGEIYGTVEHVTNMRRVGGNSNAWNIIRPDRKFGVRFSNFQPADHEPRIGRDLTGWPVSHEKLAPYVRRSTAAWGLNYDSFDASNFISAKTPALDLGPDFTTSMYLFPRASTPRDVLLADIESSDNVELVRGATAIKIDSDPSGKHATRVVAKSSDGKPFYVTFDQLIVAASGMGSARLLLNSGTAAGHTLGNPHDTVGRYLIDHPLLDGGDFVPTDPKLIRKSALYDLCEQNGEAVMGFVHPSDSAFEKYDILNAAMILLPRRKADCDTPDADKDAEPGIQAALRVRDAIRRKRLPGAADLRDTITGLGPVLGRFIKSMTQHTPNLARGGWSKRRGFGPDFDRFQVKISAEQAPHAENRVRLSDETDRLGVPKLRIDWKLHDEDARRLYAVHTLFRDSLAKAGLGTIENLPEGIDHLPVITTSCGHHMGTTRMGTDPRTSVVDANCKLHGVDNVYIASTGVIPTGGFANPTVTAISFGMLIADQLKALARSGSDLTSLERSMNHA